MALPVTIENDAIRLSVWPQIGGKISSIVDKADGFELLFNYPAEVSETSLYGKSFENTWNTGWDECFPTVAPCLYPRHPYEGIAVPDHGELWSLPTTAVPTRVRVYAQAVSGGFGDHRGVFGSQSRSVRVPVHVVRPSADVDDRAGGIRFAGRSVAIGSRYGRRSGAWV
jgi:hypothetical protein